MHVDLDAFFAAVEQRDRPELRGRPVVVGGGGPDDRGVVSAASYEARVFGVRSAMPLRTAAALCPDAVFVPVDGHKYGEVSREVMAILRRYTPRVEQISIDEAFLDVAGSEALFGAPESIARAIKSAVRSELELTVSVGVASSRLVAKIASELGKPDGLVVVPAGTEEEFLGPLPIERLWGVGRQTRRALADYRVVTIGDLAALADDVLLRRFGPHGPGLADRARGIDESPPVGEDEIEAKSVSHEHTFAADTNDWQELERTLLALSDGVAGRLRASGLKARTVTVKVRDSEFQTRTRQRGLGQPTDQTEPIWRLAVTLARPEVRGIRVRLLGVAASQLSEREQLSLFDDEPKRRRAIAAADAVRQRFGHDAITRARLLESDVPEPFERDPFTAPEARRVGREPEPGKGREGSSRPGRGKGLT